MNQRLVNCALLALAFIAGIFAWSFSVVSAAPLTMRSVSPLGLNSGDCSGSPCLTIQYAINQSSYGDRINVAAGTYTEHITMTNGVSIYGAGWPSTVINGNFSSSQPTVRIPTGIDATTVLSGVRVSGGGTGTPGTSPSGGGIFIGIASPQIINTWVYSNTGNYGGGIYVGGGSPVFSNVPAWNNYAVYGGGYALAFGSVVTITSNQVGSNGTIWSNQAINYGGGIFNDGAALYLTGTRINFNQTQTYNGGGIFLGVGSALVTISLNDISQNSAANFGGGISSNVASNYSIFYNTILSNTSSYGGGVHMTDSNGIVRYNFIMGNAVTPGDGGGMYVSGASNGLLIESNWFERNQTPSQGGGVALGTNGVTVNANTFFTNSAYMGGGIMVNPPSTGLVTLTNNILASNKITSTAGGINFANTSGRVANNTIANNQDRGLYFFNAAGIQVYNNIVISNVVGIERGDSNSYSLDYNDVTGNSTFNYSGVVTGTHDVSTNPQFIGSGNLLTFYHLRSTSPVSKTGSLAYAPPFDIDGERRAVCVSMGADQICSRSIFLPLVIR